MPFYLLQDVVLTETGDLVLEVKLCIVIIRMLCTFERLSKTGAFTSRRTYNSGFH